VPGRAPDGPTRALSMQVDRTSTPCAASYASRACVL
jgi:hypothetical protein